ncbi:hypothetical protein [Duganella sp. BuS-21]|uniref:hypothetical protein n=1 Tax=Duganella sp. BuS-21 TaxID=2943848 RepID=UPI0035A67886
MEQVLYRFTLAAAVLSSLFCASAFVINVAQQGSDSERLATAVFTVASPVAILATFYILRWIVAGRWTAKKEN